MPKKKPDETDVHAGAKLRTRRMMLKMSQEQVAVALGLTFQQVQKYEKGANRMGASRLQQLSGILKVPVSYFFVANSVNGNDADIDAIEDFTTDRDGLRIIRAFHKMAPKARHALASAFASAAEV